MIQIIWKIKESSSIYPSIHRIMFYFSLKMMGVYIFLFENVFLSDIYMYRNTYFFYRLKYHGNLSRALLLFIQRILDLTRSPGGSNHCTLGIIISYWSNLGKKSFRSHKKEGMRLRKSIKEIKKIPFF